MAKEASSKRTLPNADKRKQINRETHSICKMEDSIVKHSYQNPSKVFVDIDKLILKIIWKGTRLGIAKSILTKNKGKWISLLNIKAVYKATVIKTVILVKG